VTPTKVHLVGSIALDSVEEVFRTAGTVLGRRLRRVPDGEPGGRRLWISWQYPLLRVLPFFKADASRPNQTSGFLPLQLAEGVAPADIRFPELGYAREARASYQDFLAARKRRHLPPEVRFQVSLPTPFAVINPFFAAKHALAVEPAYEAACSRRSTRSAGPFRTKTSASSGTSASRWSCGTGGGPSPAIRSTICAAPSRRA
jgi:hypothetical protein